MLKRADRKRPGVACHSCGHPLGADHAFCPHCGAGANVPRTSGGPMATDADELHAIFDLPAADEASVDAQAPASRDRRKLVVALVAILVVFGAVATWSWLHFRDAPARDALDASRQAIAQPTAQLLEADSLDDLHAAAAEMATVEDDLSSARAAITGDTELAAAARELISAREQLAGAGAALATVTVDDFADWIDVRTSLADAVSSVEAARGALARVDEDRAAAAASPDGLVTSVETVIGSEMLASSEASFSQMFDAMGSAEDTADLREVGSTAESMGAGLAAVIDGFDSGSDERQQLDDYVGVYDAVAGLTGIDAERLTDWGDVRSAVVSSVAAVDGTDAAWPTEADGALESVDELVRAAQERLRTWQADHDAASAAKSADIDALGTYTDAMTTQLDRYSELRGSLSDWIDKVEDPSTVVTYEEGYDVLWRAETDRQAVRDAMSAMAVPSALSGAHNELVSVIDDGIAAVAAAYQGTADAEWCTTSCYYEDTPGWKTFRSESSRITDAFAVAVEQWEIQSTEALAEAENRRLPEQPVV